MPSPTFSDFAALYDFSLIEQAVQKYFCTAIPNGVFVAPPDDDDATREQWASGPEQIAFYTAFEALTFQKCRPRVYIGSFAVNEIPNTHILDANGVLRIKAWRGKMQLGIVTLPNYAQHTQLRAAVLAILPQLQPLPTPDGSGIAQGGVNALLEFHEVATFSADSQTTHITPQDGNYKSDIPISLTFSVRATAWPGGTT